MKSIGSTVRESRYVFPIHITDNAFGDTAIYQPFFDLENFAETQAFYRVGCSGEVRFQLSPLPAALGTFAGKIPPVMISGTSITLDPTKIPAFPCPLNQGVVNTRTPGGVTDLGKWAITVMMQHGMLVDVDHMSNDAVNTVLGMANSIPNGGYPVMSGHNGLRDNSPNSTLNSENNRTQTQLQRIACLGGMFGLGTAAADAYDWTQKFKRAQDMMDATFKPGTILEDGKPCGNNSLGPGSVALGTDTNSFVKAPTCPRAATVDAQPCTRASNIYVTDAVNPLNRNIPGGAFFSAHDDRHHMGRGVDDQGLGLHPGGSCSLRDVLGLSPRRASYKDGGTAVGQDIIDNHLLSSADHLFRTWHRARSQAGQVQVGSLGRTTAFELHFAGRATRLRAPHSALNISHGRIWRSMGSHGAAFRVAHGEANSGINHVYCMPCRRTQATRGTAPCSRRKRPVSYVKKCRPKLPIIASLGVGLCTPRGRQLRLISGGA